MAALIMAGMARFVLLYHECPAGYVRASHWDLMLEADGLLRTWALQKLPRAWRDARTKTATLIGSCAEVADDNRVAAERLADHRIDYLQLEGPLSSDRGSVRRIDEGSYELVDKENDTWHAQLEGQLLRTEVMLHHGMLTVRQAHGGPLPSPDGQG